MNGWLVFLIVMGSVVAAMPFTMAACLLEIRRKHRIYVAKERLRYPSSNRDRSDEDLLKYHLDEQTFAIVAGFFLAWVWPLAFIGLWAWHQALRMTEVVAGAGDDRTASPRHEVGPP